MVMMMGNSIYPPNNSLAPEPSESDHPYVTMITTHLATNDSLRLLDMRSYIGRGTSTW